MTVVASFSVVCDVNSCMVSTGTVVVFPGSMPVETTFVSTRAMDVMTSVAAGRFGRLFNAALIFFLTS